MANNNDDDFDIDPPVSDADNGAGGGPGGGNNAFGGGPSNKPSLREMWEGSPVLKLAAIVLGGVVAIGGYMMFAPGEEDIKSIVRMTDTSGVKQIPGQNELDPTYKKAVEESNMKAAVAAAQTGGSALPTPIGTSKMGGLDMAGMPEKPKFDPLAEWRRATESRRLNPDRPATDDMPEVVPMVQPIRPQQPAAKQDPNAGKMYTEQMRAILAAQAPVASRKIGVTNLESPYTVMRKQALAEEARLVSTAGSDVVVRSDGSVIHTNTVDPGKTIVPAGQVAYGQLLNELDSDIKGPVLVHILSGPFAGGRAIGKIEMKNLGDDGYLVLTFSRVVKDAVTYGINGIAMDEKTTLTGQATDIDHHYFTRIILPAAGRFVQGYGSALSQTGSVVTQTAGGGQAVSQDPPNPKQSIYKGIEEAAGTVNTLLEKNAQRSITVKIAKGTTMGLLFLDSVTTKDAGK